MSEQAQVIVKSIMGEIWRQHFNHPWISNHQRANDKMHDKSRQKNENMKENKDLSLSVDGTSVFISKCTFAFLKSQY